MSFGARSEAVSNNLPLIPEPVSGQSTLGNPVDIHPALDEVRRMGEFQPPQPGLLDELWKQPQIRALSEKLNHALGEVLEALQRLLSQIRPAGMHNLPDNIRDIFSGFVGFIIGLMVLYVFYLGLGWLLRRRQAKFQFTPATPRYFEQEQLISADHHARQANRLSRQGEYASAIRELYLATLCLLDEKQVVPFALARTNREYLFELNRKTSSELKTVFQQLARRFEAVRYGHEPMDEATFTACDQLYQQVEALTGRA